jgi:hypothetical protein
VRFYREKRERASSAPAVCSLSLARRPVPLVSRLFPSFISSFVFDRAQTHTLAKKHTHAHRPPLLFSPACSQVSFNDDDDETARQKAQWEVHGAARRRRRPPAPQRKPRRLLHLPPSLSTYTQSSQPSYLRLLCKSPPLLYRGRAPSRIPKRLNFFLLFVDSGQLRRAVLGKATCLFDAGRAALVGGQADGPDPAPRGHAECVLVLVLVSWWLSSFCFVLVVEFGALLASIHLTSRRSSAAHLSRPRCPPTRC